MLNQTAKKVANYLDISKIIHTFAPSNQKKRNKKRKVSNKGQTETESESKSRANCLKHK